MAKKSIGIITQVTGAVVDVSFEKDLPAILSALQVDHQGSKLILEIPSISTNKLFLFNKIILFE